MRNISQENSHFPTKSTTEFNFAIEQGLKRAPLERAKAVKEFFRWVRGAA